MGAWGARRGRRGRRGTRGGGALRRCSRRSRPPLPRHPLPRRPAAPRHTPLPGNVFCPYARAAPCKQPCHIPLPGRTHPPPLLSNFTRTPQHEHRTSHEHRRWRRTTAHCLVRSNYSFTSYGWPRGPASARRRWQRGASSPSTRASSPCNRVHPGCNRLHPGSTWGPPGCLRRTWGMCCSPICSPNRLTPRRPRRRSSEPTSPPRSRGAAWAWDWVGSLRSNALRHAASRRRCGGAGPRA